MIVIGVDPGKVTGIAIWVQGLGWKQAEVDAIRVLHSIRTMLGGNNPTAIACERYVQGTGRRAMSFQPDAHRVMGELSALHQEFKCAYALQLAGPAKKIASDKVLRQLGCYTPTRDGHANDACRQVIRYLANDYPDVFAALLGI